MKIQRKRNEVGILQFNVYLVPNFSGVQLEFRFENGVSNISNRFGSLLVVAVMTLEVRVDFWYRLENGP